MANVVANTHKKDVAQGGWEETAPRRDSRIVYKLAKSGTSCCSPCKHTKKHKINQVTGYISEDKSWGTLHVSGQH